MLARIHSLNQRYANKIYSKGTRLFPRIHATIIPRMHTIIIPRFYCTNKNLENLNKNIEILNENNLKNNLNVMQAKTDSDVRQYIKKNGLVGVLSIATVNTLKIVLVLCAICGAIYMLGVTINCLSHNDPVGILLICMWIWIAHFLFFINL